MFKKLFPLLLLLAACSDSDNHSFNSSSGPQPSKHQLYVVNQGSYYDGIDGSISIVNTQDTTVVNNAFSAANNGISLGNSPQPATLADGKIYVPVLESNVVWVLNTNSLEIVSSIVVNTPVMVEVAASKIFVTGNDGFVNCYNTANYELIERIEVGPNPWNMAVVNNTLYVSISDGYNYPTYENGFRLAQLDVNTLQLGEYINIGMNPGQICADYEGDLYVVCRGNYADIASQVIKVDPVAKTYEYVCDGSFIALSNQKMYVVNMVTNWETYESHTYYQAYDVTTDALISENFLEGQPLPQSPIAMHCNNEGDIFITSNFAVYDYTSPGYVYHYAANGTYKGTYAVGVAPCGIVFNE